MALLPLCDGPPANLSHLPPVNRKGVRALQGQHPDQSAAIYAAAATVTRVTFTTFMQTLEVALRPFSDLSGRCTILVEKNKSNEWVPGLVRKHFGFTGTYLELGRGNAATFTHTLRMVQDKKKQTASIDRSHLQHIFIFDDLSASGQQMFGHVSNIVRVLKDKKKGIDGLGPEKHVHIYVVVPFMTNVAEKRLQEVITGSYIKLHIASHTTVTSLWESVSAAEYGQLAAVFPELSAEADSGIGTTYFEHKVPNNKSFVFGDLEGDLAVTSQISPPYKA